MYNINTEENEKAAKELVDCMLLWQDLLIKIKLLYENLKNKTNKQNFVATIVNLELIKKEKCLFSL